MTTKCLNMNPPALASHKNSHGRRKFYDIPLHNEIRKDKEETEEETSSTQKSNLLEYIDHNVIGRNKVFSGPFGLRKGI